MTEEEKKEFIRLLDMISPFIKKHGYKAIKFPDDDKIVEHVIQITRLDSGCMRITHILSSPPAFGRGFSEICLYYQYRKHKNKLLFFGVDEDNVPEYVMFGRCAAFDMKKLFHRLDMMIVELL